MGLDALKKLKEQDSVEELKKQLEKDSNNFEKDSRLWYPQIDREKGTATAVIRFLPASESDGDYPSFIKFFKHSFKLNDKWYIENCPTTVKKGDNVCPVCNANKKIYGTNSKEVAKNKTAGRTRRARYISNILVIDDPENPENNGKVKLLEYGNEIYGLIENKIKPKFDHQKAINPFDFWNGCDFIFNIYKDKGNVKYDASEWSEQKPVAESDENIATIWEQCHSLSEYFDNIEFKSFEKLSKRWTYVSNEKVETSSIENDMTENTATEYLTGNTIENDNSSIEGYDELQQMLNDS